MTLCIKCNYLVKYKHIRSYTNEVTDCYWQNMNMDASGGRRRIMTWSWLQPSNCQPPDAKQVQLMRGNPLPIWQRRPHRSNASSSLGLLCFTSCSSSANPLTRSLRQSLRSFAVRYNPIVKPASHAPGWTGTLLWLENRHLLIPSTS